MSLRGEDTPTRKQFEQQPGPAGGSDPKTNEMDVCASPSVVLATSSRAFSASSPPPPVVMPMSPVDPTPPTPTLTLEIPAASSVLFRQFKNLLDDRLDKMRAAITAEFSTILTKMSASFKEEMETQSRKCEASGRLFSLCKKSVGIVHYGDCYADRKTL